MSEIKCLISEDEIADAVARLGRKITEDYAKSELTILGILTGSIVLVTDLMRQIDVSHQLGLVQASSYRGKTTEAGDLRINLDFLPEIRGRDVLLVDDIFDTGKTITKISQQLELFEPKKIRTAVLLWKKSRSEVETVPDYHCFEIPDEFVVGYGLDYNGEYRNLPYIGVLES
jgi:hypoxanthine phosphoribosyltransferase